MLDIDDGEVGSAEEGEEGWNGVFDFGVVAVSAVERCVVIQTCKWMGVSAL